MTVIVLKSYLKKINQISYLLGAMGNPKTMILEHKFCKIFQFCIYLVIPHP